MHYNISGFTHIGTVRKNNQDRILAHEQILSEGSLDVEAVKQCLCCVADGIGGNPAGDVAAQFVLERLLAWKQEHHQYSEEKLQATLEQINTELIAYGQQQREYAGLSTTFVGLFLEPEQYFILSAGDSPMWLLRHEMFYQLTENQVLNPYEKDSPLVSYFGGKESELDLQFCHDLREIQPEDIFLLCSDGLFKSLTQKHIKAILSSNQPLVQKAQFLLQKVEEHGADDNVSCILIEVQDDC